MLFKSQIYRVIFKVKNWKRTCSLDSLTGLKIATQPLLDNNFLLDGDAHNMLKTR